MNLNTSEAINKSLLFAVTGSLIIAGLAWASGLWECNYCHQQYQGTTPPAFAKCPAKDMKQNHWWLSKLSSASGLWECNYCHQQYQGTSSPAFAKCPAKDMKQNHWWTRK